MSSESKDAGGSREAAEVLTERPIDMSPKMVTQYKNILARLDDNEPAYKILSALDCPPRRIDDALEYRRRTVKLQPAPVANIVEIESWQHPEPEKKWEPMQPAESTVPAYQFKTQPKSEPVETAADPVARKPKEPRKVKAPHRTRQQAADDKAMAGRLSAAIKTQAYRPEPTTPASNPVAVKAAAVTPSELRDMSDIAKEVLDALVVVGETTEEVLRSREDDFRSKALRQAFVIFTAYRQVDIEVAGSFLSRNLMSAQAIFRYGLEALRDETRPTSYFVRQLCLKFDVQFNTLKKAYSM